MLFLYYTMLTFLLKEVQIILHFTFVFLFSSCELFLKFKKSNCTAQTKAPQLFARTLGSSFWNYFNSILSEKTLTKDRKNQF